MAVEPEQEKPEPADLPQSYQEFLAKILSWLQERITPEEPLAQGEAMQLAAAVAGVAKYHVSLTGSKYATAWSWLAMSLVMIEGPRLTRKAKRDAEKKKTGREYNPEDVIQ